MAAERPITVFTGAVLPEWIDYNGHMNVAFYTLAFDKGTDGLLDYIGMDEAYRDRSGESVFTLETHVKYFQELRLADPIRCTLQLIDHNGKLVHYFLRLHHATEDYLAATCELMLLSVDLKQRRSRPLAANFTENLDRLLEQHRNLAEPEQLGEVIQIRR